MLKTEAKLQSTMTCGCHGSRGENAKAAMGGKKKKNLSCQWGNSPVLFFSFQIDDAGIQ